jgi:hypothetical protein
MQNEAGRGFGTGIGCYGSALFLVIFAVLVANFALYRRCVRCNGEAGSRRYGESDGKIGTEAPESGAFAGGTVTGVEAAAK